MGICKRLFYLPIFAFLFASCASNTTTPSVDPSPVPPIASATADIQSPNSTDEVLVPKVLFIANPSVQIKIQDQILLELQQLTNAQEWILEQHTNYLAANIDPQVRVVVALPPNPEIEQWADQTPNVQFVAIGIPGITIKPNLSVIGSNGFRDDQLSFLAGYIAAVITPDWRVGTLVDDAAEVSVAGFRNGVVYYCGLCRLTYPPYYDYPLSFFLNPDRTENAWRQAAEYFTANAVNTLFIDVEAYETAMLDILTESGLTIFGGLEPANSDAWIATLRFAPEIPLRQQWDALIEGEGAWNIEIPIVIEDVNQELLSIGKLQWIEKLMDELQTGFVDPSVTPIGSD